MTAGDDHVLAVIYGCVRCGRRLQRCCAVLVWCKGVQRRPGRGAALMPVAVCVLDSGFGYRR